MALARTGRARGACGVDETRDRCAQQSSHGTEREPVTTTRPVEQKLETPPWEVGARLALRRGRDVASDARLPARKSCS